MFSALKRLTGKGDGVATGVSSSGNPPAMQAMSSSLQKKFSRGVQYNMKIIIRGDRSVGKTCLFLRLQGDKFREEYVPSEEIAVASIQWSYKATDDVVKVEVWDVVDKGKKRRPMDGLKLATTCGDLPEEPALDAEFLDVYKGTNGVVLVMDVTKAWTFEYIQRELPRVPGHVPVLVLANHCDMAHHRTVTSDHVTFYLESLEREAPVRYTEGSMRNGFGLRYLHKFLNVPFLQLQRQTLLAQVRTNEQETALTLQELDLFAEKDEANYDVYLEQLTAKRRTVAESSGAMGALQPMNTQPPPTPLEGGVIKKSLSVPAHLATGVVSPLPSGIPSLGVNQVASGQQQQQQQGSNKTVDIIPAVEALSLGPLDTSIASVEEFVPDGGTLDHSFLEDPASASPAHLASKPDEESDSEPETHNPLVSGFQDDLDPDDLVVTSAVTSTVTSEAVVVRIKESPASSISSAEDLSSLGKGSEPPPTVLSDWLLPDKARRSSPEGREEEEGEAGAEPALTFQLPPALKLESVVEPLTEIKKKKSSKKDKSSSSSTSEKKKPSKEKTKKRKKKERDELEDFLSGSAPDPVEEAYEAL